MEEQKNPSPFREFLKRSENEKTSLTDIGIYTIGDEVSIKKFPKAGVALVSKKVGNGVYGLTYVANELPLYCELHWQNFQPIRENQNLNIKAVLGDIIIVSEPTPF
jgi:hypothetical protein